MQNDAHHAMSTSGMMEQNAHAAIFHSGLNARPNSANHAKIRSMLVSFEPCLRIRPEFLPERTQDKGKCYPEYGHCDN